LKDYPDGSGICEAEEKPKLWLVINNYFTNSNSHFEFFIITEIQGNKF
jgi:hypothetical protein